MCTCKKNSRLEQLLKNLEGFFDYAGSSLPYEDVYSFLLSSLYQLDDDGNKVLVNSDNESGKFIIDIDKPVCVGALFDNTSNLYNDIVKCGFKPIYNYDAKESENSVIIDAVEDSVLPISYNKDTGVCTFNNNVKLLSLPRVNFYIYTQYDGAGILRPEFSGSYLITRNEYETTGIYNYPTEFENTGAIDNYGNIIQRAKASVLMLQSDNANSNEFVLGGVYEKNGKSYSSKIDNYSFDGSVGYGQEVNATSNHVLAHVNFVNADSNHADLVPTDSCQFVGKIGNMPRSDLYDEIPFGKKWGIECNDIYFPKKYNNIVVKSENKLYIDIDNYIIYSLNFGLCNIKLVNKDKPMYLYNIEDNKRNIDISDTIDLAVKRLPVINLTEIFVKPDFDSSKPYIYARNIKWGMGRNSLICNYDDLNSEIILQVGTKLSKQTVFEIYCSSTAPDDSYSCNLDDGNAIKKYDLICQPTEMNEEVQYKLTRFS